MKRKEREQDKTDKSISVGRQRLELKDETHIMEVMETWKKHPTDTRQAHVHRRDYDVTDDFCMFTQQVFSENVP